MRFLALLLNIFVQYIEKNFKEELWNNSNLEYPYFEVDNLDVAHEKSSSDPLA